MTDLSMPYFDTIFGDANIKETKLNDTLNMHWGYWEEPFRAYAEEKYNFRSASEKMGRLVYEVAEIADGFKLGDIGCGFGGTIADLNARYHNLDMTGLNIDIRQIEIARTQVTPMNNNKVEFTIGDACDLPFEDASLDALLAVECIFHFTDREKFFSEVSRVLKPGAKFAFSDFVPLLKSKGPLHHVIQVLKDLVGKEYGSSSIPLTLSQYDEIGKKYRLKNIYHRDITRNTLPTFKAIYSSTDMFYKGFNFHRKFPTKVLEITQRLGLVKYLIVGYQKI